MQILYIIQTFKAPEQIQRLVQTIKRSSPNSQIIISHDYTASYLAPEPLQILGAQVLNLKGKGVRGSFLMLEGYLDALKWARIHQIAFDWVINLSGEDYPTQSLPVIEQFLGLTHYDGFLEHFEAFSNGKENPWGSQEAHNRYLYQYWRSGLVMSSNNTLLDKILFRAELAIHKFLPFLEVCAVYDCFAVGAKARSPIFNKKFLCYGGGYYHTLSRRCVEYLYNYYENNPEIVAYYRRTLVPDESFIQTILINSGLFNISNDYKRYIEFPSEGDTSRTRTLTAKDYPALIQGNIHFARKFKPDRDSQILELLDARIFKEHTLDEPKLVP